MKGTRYVLLGSLLFVSGVVCAEEASTSNRAQFRDEANVGNNSYVNSLRYDGSQSAPFPWAWSFEFGLSDSQSAVGIDFSEHLSGGVTKSLEADWKWGGGVNYSVCPLDSLTAIGPELFVGKMFRLGTISFDDDESVGQPVQSRVEPTIDIQAGLAFNEYLHSAPLATPSMLQTELRLGVIFSLVKQATLSAHFSSYFYNQNATTFSQSLLTTQSVRVSTTGFMSVLSGFQSETAELNFTFEWIDRWKFIVGSSFATAIDFTGNVGVHMAANYDLSPAWNVGLGGQYLPSPFVQNWSVMASVTKR